MYLLLILMVSLAQESSLLHSTRYIDTEHPLIQQTARELTAGIQSDREKAIRIHDFVRDEIRFGWSRAFYDQKASDVLKGKIGYCNTKSTLFIALLRAAGIQARQHFVNIDARILSGLLDPGTRYVDHSYTEVLLNGTWVKTDSYIVDIPLAREAKARLANEGRLIGYGVHRNGTSYWDGKKDSFSQYVDDGSIPLSTRDYGIYEDVGDFYASGNGVNKRNLFLRLTFGFFSRNANKKIEGIRKL